MVHEGQGLALSLEAGDDLFGVHPQLDHFDGDPAPDRFLLLGHIDHAATTFADLLEQLVAAYSVARFFAQPNHARRYGKRLGARVGRRH